MIYDIEICDDRQAVFRLHGRLDASSFETFRGQLKATADRGLVELIIDMGDVSFIDSSGLSALVSGFRAVREKQGRLVLANPGPQVRLALELTRLNQVFATYSSVEEARKALAPV